LPVANLRGTSERRDQARVTKRLGGDAHAIYPAGGVIGSLLHKLLDEEGVASHNSTIASETRGDFFVHEISTGEQYRFILSGPQLRIPIYSGRVFRREAGHRYDLKPSTIPK
jgi:6-phosphofructokinase 2